MKMTRSTSSTSIIGVMFMSARLLELRGAVDALGAVVLMGSHLFASAGLSAGDR